MKKRLFCSVRSRRRQASTRKYSTSSRRDCSAANTDSGKRPAPSDVGSLLAALKECSRFRNLEKGRELHLQAISTGESSYKYVANSLINMYGKCGSMVEAQDVFDSMENRSTVSWNALLQGYAENGENNLVLEIFHRMEEQDEQDYFPNARTYMAALTACAALASRRDEDIGKKSSASSRRRWTEQAKAIHSRAMFWDCCDMFVESGLVDMYARCGFMHHAQQVFDKMVKRDVVVWNSLLQGYVENGESLKTLELLDEAGDQCDYVPNARTYMAALTACASLGGQKSGEVSSSSKWLEKGKALHSRAVVERSCDEFVQSMLVDMYAKCGNMLHARGVFDNMDRHNAVSWNSLLQGYVENGQSFQTLELFDAVEEAEDGFVADSRTYVAAITACAALGGETRNSGNSGSFDSRNKWLEKGKAAHSAAVRNSCCDIFVETALINMYARLGSMGNAQKVFDNMKERNVVSWNSLVQGYVENGDNHLALEAIDRMNTNATGVEPNSATFVTALLACGNLLAVEKGEAFHTEIQRAGFDKDVLVATCLVDFYGKCGKMESAAQVFGLIPVKDIWAWNTLLTGYSQQGDCGRLFDAFQKMREQGIAPNEITFTQLLSACGHAGLTEKGREIFTAMLPRYKVRPDIRHYTCMVDLLGRANRLDEALKMVEEMPCEADSVIWCSLLGACRKWNNAKVGRVAYQGLIKVDENEASAYVLMANICGSAENMS